MTQSAGKQRASATRKRDPEATRARILAAAGRLLVLNDGALEMAWVAKEAGVSQGLAYHHFGSREGLIEAVVGDFYDRLEAEVLLAPLKELGEWESRELQRSERYIRFLAEDPLGATLMARLSRTPAIAMLEAERWEQLVREGAKNIAEGQRRGVVRSQQDSALLAALVLGALRSAVAAAMQRNENIDPRSLTGEIWQFLRLGLEISEEN